MWIGIGAVAAVGLIGTGVSLYATLAVPHANPARLVVAKVGEKSAAPAVAKYLAVLNSEPAATSQGVALDSVVKLKFNLPVAADSVKGYFSVLPATEGVLVQGAGPDEVSFRPDANFAPGSSISIVIRRGLSSVDGYTLQDDYNLSFHTAIASGGAAFQAGYQLARLVNAVSGTSVVLSLRLGTDVPATIQVQTFHASRSDLLAAFVHSGKGAFLGGLIKTSSMTLMDTRAALKNGDQLTVAQPDGIYLVLAGQAGAQYGSAWVVFSRYGVILRQDDQKIVAAGEDLSSGDTTPRFDITFYGLQDVVKPISAGSFSGTGEFAARYPSGIDLAVASSGGEEVVVPLAVPETDGDVKVVADLAQQPQIFLTTDRAGYQQGDAVNFAGFARLSNDQAYTVPAGSTIKVWSGARETPLVAKNVTVAADGTFSGSFAIPATVFRTDGIDLQLPLFADLDPSRGAQYSPVFTTSVIALGPHTPTALLTVTFDKPVYVSKDTIVATIAGVGSAGKPLANKAVNLNIFSAQHSTQPSEVDSFPAPNIWGQPAQQNLAVTLDASGHATYSFKAKVTPTASDQEVTLEAVSGTGADAAVGSRTAIVYQAADELFLGTMRQVYRPGDQIVAPFLVETREGARAANAAVAYEVDRTDYQGTTASTTVAASGSLNTDANGLGTVRVKGNWPTGGLLLRVVGQDAAGSSFEDDRWLTISSDNQASLSFASGGLERLEVTTDKVAYNTGDTAQLAVTSPTAENALLSLDRGRVHRYQWVKLAQGDTSVPISITPDLVPGLTATFSYFVGGSYVTEGVPIRVSGRDRILKLSVKPDRATYTAGQTAHLSISVVDGTGAPASAAFSVDAYDAGMSAAKLVDQPSAPGAFLIPAVRGTSASSSLVGIGDWGGRCGGGGGVDQLPVTYPGKTYSWQPHLATDATGKATVDIVVPAGTTRVALVAASGPSTWGQAEIDLAAS